MPSDPTIPVDEQLLGRIDVLLTKGDIVLASYKPRRGSEFLEDGDDRLHAEWASQAQTLLRQVLEEAHPYRRNFHGGNSKSTVAEGLGILTALREDLANGHLLANTRRLIAAAVFRDFLSMAKHLIDSGFKDPAASLTGAVLEDSLRRIAASKAIPVTSGDGIGSLNQKLAQATAYNAVVHAQVNVWRQIRNNADHGQFGEYTQAQVVDMHRGVSNLIAQHLR
jgi:hypothetical protein